MMSTFLINKCVEMHILQDFYFLKLFTGQINIFGNIIEIVINKYYH